MQATQATGHDTPAVKRHALREAPEGNHRGSKHGEQHACSNQLAYLVEAASLDLALASHSPLPLPLLLLLRQGKAMACALSSSGPGCDLGALGSEALGWS